MGLRCANGFWMGALLALTWPCAQASAEPVPVPPLVAADGALTLVPWAQAPLPVELIPLSWTQSQLPLALSPLPWDLPPPPELVPVAWDG